MEHRRSIQYEGKKTSSVIDLWDIQGGIPIGSFIVLQFRKDVSSGVDREVIYIEDIIGSICQINS